MDSEIISDMRMVKFDRLIKDIDTDISKVSFLNELVRYRKNILSLIYDYEKLNDFGKVILNKIRLNLDSSYSFSYSIEELKDIKTRIEAAKEYINYCQNNNEKYKFLFWSLMVLAVDKTDADENLSLICDFARMLKVSDTEMEDIVKVIKIVFHEEDKGFKFETETIPDIFSRVINIYNN